MVLQDDFNQFVKILLTLQFINKLYHWNTLSHARHQATDGFASSLNDLIDKFVEVYIGRHDIKPIISSIKFDLQYFNDDNIDKYYKQVRKFIDDNTHKLISSELINIKDEILSEINKIIYLFTQK